MSVGGGVKGTIKLRLSLEGPPPIRNVYQRCSFVRGGGGGNSLAGTNTVAILQRWFRTFELKI